MASSEQYCLHWNDHRNTLLSNLERLLENSSSVDCTLAAEGQYLKGHKVVLSACSPFFEALLNQEKDKHPIIFMRDIKFQELKAIMSYMYRGEVVIPQDQLAELLKAAESLQIKGLGWGEKEQIDFKNKNVSQQLQHQHHQKQQQKTMTVQPVRQQLSQVAVQPVRQLSPVVMQPVQQHSQVAMQPVQQQSPVALQSVRQLPSTLTASRQQPSPAGQSVRRQIQLSPSNVEKVRVSKPTAPQVVDLTDEKAPPKSVSPKQQMQDNVKQLTSRTYVRFKKPAAPSMPGKSVQNMNLASMVMSGPSQNPMTDITANQASSIQGSLVVHSSTALGIPNSPVINSNVHSEVLSSPVAPTHQVENHEIVESANKESTSSPLLILKVQSLAQNNNNLGNVSPISPVQQDVPTPLSSGKPELRNVSSVPSDTDPPVPVSESESLKITIQAKHNVASPTQTSEAKKRKTITIQSTVPSSESSEDMHHESASDRTKVSDSEMSENLSETPVENPDNNAGPSVPKVTKPGRRRRNAAERRFHCPECPKKFSHKGNLDNHFRIHDGDTYQCDVCDKKFLARATLIRHLHSHESNPSTQHKCQLCGSSFSASAELEKHLTEHALSATDDDDK